MEFPDKATVLQGGVSETYVQAGYKEVNKWQFEKEKELRNGYFCFIWTKKLATDNFSARKLVEECPIGTVIQKA